MAEVACTAEVAPFLYKKPADRNVMIEVWTRVRMGKESEILTPHCSSLDLNAHN